MTFNRGAASVSFLGAIFSLIIVSTGPSLGQEKAGAVQTPTTPTGTVSTQSADEGRVFESPEGGFRIRLPRDFRDPIRQTRVLKKDGVSFPAFVSVSDRGTFTIAPFEPPTGLTASPEFLKKAIQLDLEILKLEAEREGVLKRSQEMGYEVFAKGPMKSLPRFARIQIIAARHRWFEITLISPTNDFRDSREVEGVFHSFEVLPETMLKAFMPESTVRLAYDSPDGVFKMELPPGFQPPIDQTALVSGKLKGFKGRQYLSTGPSGLLMLTRFFEIRGLNTKADIATARDGMTNGIIEALKGKIISSKSVIHDGRSWREVRFTGEISGQLFNGRGRILGQKGEIHLFLYLSPSDEVLDSPETDRVFDSIKLNPR
jgi:hypothetical protein